MNGCMDAVKPQPSGLEMNDIEDRRPEVVLKVPYLALRQRCLSRRGRSIAFIDFIHFDLAG